MTDKNFPRITIERTLWDDEGHLVGIDLHDEKFGEAIFFEKGHTHHHGFLNEGKYKE